MGQRSWARRLGQTTVRVFFSRCSFFLICYLFITGGTVFNAEKDDFGFRIVFVDEVYKGLKIFCDLFGGTLGVDIVVA